MSISEYRYLYLKYRYFYLKCIYLYLILIRDICFFNRDICISNIGIYIKWVNTQTDIAKMNRDICISNRDISVHIWIQLSLFKPRITINKVKYLGVMLDQELSGEAIANEVIKKVNARLGFMYWQGYFLTSSMRKTLCNSLIQCHFDYASSSWYSTLSKYFQKKVASYSK